jgi:hypothetical protein
MTTTIVPARYCGEVRILGSHLAIQESGRAFEQSCPSSHSPGTMKANEGIVPDASADRSGPAAGVPIGTSLRRQEARRAGKYTAGLCLGAYGYELLVLQLARIPCA